MSKDESTWDERLPKPPKAGPSIMPPKNQETHIHVHIHFDDATRHITEKELTSIVSKAMLNIKKLQGI